MLADNIVWLKKNKPELYNQVKSWEEKDKKPNFILEKTKDGNDTLKYQNDGQTVYLHSKYSPIREANAVIDQLAEQEEISEESQVLFYGIGMGYHIEAFIKRFPDTFFLIVEPSVEVLSIFLGHRLLKNFASKNMKLLQCNNSFEKLYNQIVQSKEKKLVICEHPVYPKIFKQEYADFLDNFKNTVKEQRSSLHTNFAFKQRWIINSVNNFEKVLKTPNILLDSDGTFKEKTAIMVAAGPSLDLEIENLRKIKELGLAYIFSVGSTINTLIHHGIEPDAMCTYDPKKENQMVFKKVNEFGIKSIPMIFGSSVGYEVLKQYSGPKYHMITSQDTIAQYFLKTVSHESIEMVNDAPSIAVVTLELLAKLGFSKIVLVGQNLAYFDEKIYASEIDYITDEITERVLNSEELVTESVDGRKVKTSQTFLNMKRQLEQTIEKYRANVINTTVGGAKIKGTCFKPLKQLIDEELADSSIREYPIERIEKTKQYDRDYALTQLEKLKNAYQVFQNLITEIKNYLLELQALTNLNLVKEMQQTHIKMDNQIRKLEENDYFKIIALPINRVEYGLLLNVIEKSRNEKNHLRNAKNIFKSTEGFIDLLYTQMDLNNKIMLVLENSVRNFA